MWRLKATRYTKICSFKVSKTAWWIEPIPIVASITFFQTWCFFWQELSVIDNFIWHFVVCSPLPTGSERHGPCFTSHRFWGAHPRQGWGRKVCSGLYTSSISYFTLHGFGCPHSICGQWWAHPALLIGRLCLQFCLFNCFSNHDVRVLCHGEILNLMNEFKFGLALVDFSVYRCLHRHVHAGASVANFLSFCSVVCFVVGPTILFRFLRFVV